MVTEVSEYTFKVTSPAKLNVRNIRGEVTLVPGTDGEIKIEVITHPDSGNPDYTRIELNQRDDGEVEAVVRTPDDYFGFMHRKPLRVDFRIEAPVQTNMNVKIVSGSIAAHGFEGKIRLASVSGSVHVRDLSGDLDLDSVSGKVAGENLRGKGRISAVSGKVDLKDCDFSSLKASTVSGHAQVQTQFHEGPYDFNAVSGGLLVVVPEGTGCEVSASAVSGRFYTDMDVSQSSVGKRSWRVRIGQGGPSVRMKTVSGKMRLLSSFDATGSVPGEVRMSHKARKDVLSRLQDGEISVDEALKELG